MPIKHSLLTFLSEAPMSASELREKFEQEMGGIYALNQGQVSQTMTRLMRDNLVHSHEVTSPNGRTVSQYSLTDAGVEELNNWWNATIDQPGPTRDELVIKFTLAARRDPATFIELLDAQRFATLRQLRTLSAEAAALPSERSAERLHIERRIFELEGILRWLDRIEALSPIATINDNADAQDKDHE